MTTHLQPKPSEIVQRFRFNTRVRQPLESVATYATQLKRLAEHCNFIGGTDGLNEKIRDRLVCGIANEKWQQRLLAEDSLMYNKAYKLLLGLKASEKQVKDLTTTEMKSIHQLRPARQSSTLNSLCPGKVAGKPQQYSKQREKEYKPVQNGRVP